MQKPRVLYLGRFQPFHKGHLWILQQALRSYDVVLAIGSAQHGGDSLKNPFTTAEREEMIRLVLRAYNISIPTIYQVPDIPKDEEYVAHVEAICGPCDIVISAEKDYTRDLFEDAGYHVQYFGRADEISATDIRDRICTGRKWRHLVPHVVVEYLDRIGAEDRIQKLCMKEM